MTSQVTTRRSGQLARFDTFVAHVQKMCRSDPGSRAALRSGLGRRPEVAHRMHGVVARWVPDDADDADGAIERAYYSVASLIAAQPPDAREEPLNVAQEAAASPVGTRTRPNLGRSLGIAVAGSDEERRGIAAGSAERRLHLLVRQGLDGVHRHLPSLVRHLRAGGVPVDWAQLADDLSRWPTDHDLIAKRWLQSYYRAAPAASTDDEQEQK